MKNIYKNLSGEDMAAIQRLEREHFEKNRGPLTQKQSKAGLPSPYEEDIQIQFFNWVRYAENRYPELKFFFHVPNGGARHKKTGAMLKAGGVRAGVPDIWFPYRTDKHIGLVFEFKRAGGRISKDQEFWLTYLEAQGWKTAVCYSSDEAIKLVCEYINIKLPENIF